MTDDRQCHSAGAGRERNDAAAGLDRRFCLRQYICITLCTQIFCKLFYCPEHAAIRADDSNRGLIPNPWATPL